MFKRFSFWIVGLFMTGLIAFTGCKQSLIISEVDYAQPVETVLESDENGVVNDVRHGLKFNILPLQYSETGDSASVTTNEIRLIRGQEGFYYITAPGYRNVYVMAPEKNSLKLINKIKVSEEGIEKPAFNQREPYVQLLNQSDNKTYQLTSEGVKKESEQKNIGQGGNQ